MDCFQIQQIYKHYKTLNVKIGFGLRIRITKRPKAVQTSLRKKGVDIEKVIEIGITRNIVKQIRKVIF